MYLLASNLVPYEHDGMIKFGFILFIFLYYAEDPVPNTIVCTIVSLIIMMVEMPVVLD